MKIAIDGPAGSGKSSTARAVARELGFRHLDSGAFYRTLTHAALAGGIEPATWEELGAAQLDALEVDALAVDGGYAMRVGGREVGKEIRTPAVNAQVSRMAAVPGVREWLLGALRRAGEGGGVVADGRDIGTVVFPDAELKVFLVADPAERARRRLAEQGLSAPTPYELREEVARQEERDRRDSTRAVAPLRRAPDAVRLDTTALAFDDQVQAIIDLARVRMRER
jgi:CMP/dCMP kinase